MSPRAWTLFGIASFLWGIPYLFISIAVEDGIPPAFLAWFRVVLGALILLPIAWRAGLLGTLRDRWRWIVPYAVLEIVIPFPMIAAGEQHVSSSVTAILIASTPLLVALLAIRFDHSERVGGLRLVGLFTGLAGVVFLVGVDIAGNADELLGSAAIMVAVIGYAAGPMLLNRKLGDVDARATMLATLATAGLLLTVPAFADLPAAEALTGEEVASLVVLGVLCTAAAFVVFGMLVTSVGAGRALLITYVNPLVAIAAGVVVLGERPGPGAIAGLLLIFAGCYLATGGRVTAPFRRLPGSDGSLAGPDPEG